MLRRGFTLIEMLVVFAVIAVLVLVSSLNLYSSRNQTNLESNMQMVTALLREAQARSVSQYGGTGWGVHFDNSHGTFSLFPATSTASSFNSSTALGTYRLQTGICFSNINQGSSTDIIFSSLGGRPANSVNILLTKCNGTSTVFWTATTPLSSPRDLGKAVAYRGYLYLMGANPYDASVPDVSYAPIRADGSLGNWTTMPNSFPGGDSNFYISGTAFALSAYNGFLYFIGLDSQSAPMAYYAPVYSDGSLGSWTATTPLPSAISYQSGLINNGYFYSLGGSQAGSNTSTVFYAPVSASGIGAWSATTPLPNPDSAFFSFVDGNYIFEIGGNGATSSVASAYAAPVSTGISGPWQSVTPLPMPIAGMLGGIDNGNVYLFGGVTGGNQLVETVYYTAVSSDGTLGTWSPTIALPSAVTSEAGASYNGYFYFIGGYDETTGATSSVYYASLSNTGVIQVTAQGNITSQ